MTTPYRFNRLEISGSLGDLGTLLPLAMGMIMVNGLPVTGVFYSIGFFYIFAGLYFGVPVPVQPMKVISAYAIATGISGSQISGSAAIVALILLIISLTGTIDFIGKIIPKPVIRGVQLSTGMLLISHGLKMILGSSPHQIAAQAGEPYLTTQSIGPVPIGLILGVIGVFITLIFIKNKKYPAGIILILLGLFTGIFLGKHDGFSQLQLGIFLPEILPFGLPSRADMAIVFFVLVLPQMPMTIGNAIIANVDLSKEYFSEDSKKVTYKATTLSMAIANAFSSLLGGIPMCHGAGGLAAHYKFGARTGGSNIIIGTIFLVLAIFFGPHALAFVHLLPLSILGVLLIFAGSQLGLTILDMFSRKDMFLVLTILAITFISNLAWGFGIGLVLAHLLRSERFSV